MKIPEIKIPKEKIITKFCLFVHTKNFAIDGYFTGFYQVKGEQYIENDSDFSNERIKFFTVEDVYKKAENLFFDFGFESLEDCIYVCDQTGKKIKRYNGVDWNMVL
jgi:hypothetical protein